jgi:hypothetical protein
MAAREASMNCIVLAFVGLLGLYGVSGLILPSSPDVPMSLDDVLDDPSPDDDGGEAET